MAMTVEVPVLLLEDIFRLLDYLDDVGDRDCPHFRKTGRGPCFGSDNALWELKLKIKRLQRQIVETYLTTIDGVTEEERNDLYEWVAGGDSVYDNPCSIYDESGQPMDFINGCRMALDMYLNRSDCFGGAGPEWADGNWDEEDLPF